MIRRSWIELLIVTLFLVPDFSFAAEVNYDDPNLKYRSGYVSDRRPKVVSPPLHQELPTSTLDLPQIEYADNEKTENEPQIATPSPSPKPKKTKLAP